MMKKNKFNIGDQVVTQIGYLQNLTFDIPLKVLIIKRIEYLENDEDIIYSFVNDETRSRSEDVLISISDIKIYKEKLLEKLKE
jgi:hypothetical protein